MDIRTLVRRVLGRDPQATVVSECFRCGTTVTEDDDECPNCGSAEIVHTEISE